jgi:sugar lactone lactonase YvrE
MELQLFSNTRLTLGEGPVYDVRLKSVFWVDILGMKIMRKNLETGLETILRLPDMVSSLCVVNEETIILTMRHSFSLLTLKDGSLKELARVEEDKENNRFNDGKCDKLGRYWAGTMDMKERNPTGSLYKFFKSPVEVFDGLTISNGLGWDPDNEVMYLIDTPKRKVFAFDFDLSKGEIYNMSIAVDFGHEPGNPDGMAVDEEGFLWVAHWGGGKVSRWSPKGEKKGEIKVQVSKVTSITFGGEDMNEVFITTAKGEEPLSGYIFTGKAEVSGIPNYRFRL